MTGAEQVISALKQHKITTIFGYPGGTIMPVYDRLLDTDIEHILCRHEQGAAIAAIGYARAAGTTGVCMATSGPGATNLITGLADAMLDSIPLVAITGQVASPLIGTDAFQEVDVLGLSLGCTKHSFLVTDPSELADVLEQAFTIASSGRPGPVLVDITKDALLAEVPQQEIMSMEPVKAPEPEHKHLVSARQLIAESQRPMLYIGGGVVLGQATGELRDFIDATQIPSVTTLKALGTVPYCSPYYLGMLGMHGNQAANHAIQQCDLLVVIGARFDDRVTGKLAEFAPNAKVIHLDIDAAEIGKFREVSVPMRGDLRQLLPHLTLNNLQLNEWQQQVAELKQQYAWRYDHPGERIYAPLLLRQLSDRVCDKTIITTDVGQHQMWAAQHMQPAHPQNFISSSGLGTMGYGLPAAIGAKEARPEDPVVLITGDGSFMMNVQEMATLKRRKLPVKILLLDNQRLGMVKQWQELFFEERYSETDLSDNPDFVTMARAFDIPGRTITTKSEVPAAIEDLLTSSGSYLLHVRISEQDNVWPLVPPGAANHKMLEGNS
ncbi:acetolactate synthase 2 catalytic subunit [Dongshaea marina]|uniref:acetolactate synthase 2 catalytic subunit n=1 Tax=Dongshaea marina TaxID=2047966 RepID=UPI000D3E1075|nr:acetolactate synthase 2 catalytic subunit [Dongshaea marina]